MNKHTPGPWKLTPTKSHVFIDTMEQGGCICKLPCKDSVLQWASEPGSLENSANARLIAAAPDLSEALLSYVKAYEIMADDRSKPELKSWLDIEDNARAALRAAGLIE